MSYGPPPPGNPGPPHGGGYGPPTGGYGPPPGGPGGYGPPSGGQPGFGGQPPSTEPPKNYLWMNVIGIFGCTIAGIIGLIFALQVSSKWQMGDYAGAESSAKTAKICGIIGLVGAALWILYIIFLIIVTVVAVNSGPTYYP